MRGIAAFARSSTPRIVEHREPSSAGQGEVRCRTLQLGICGTDREILESQSPVLPPGGEHLVLGHECLARVEERGPGVSTFDVGDLVVPVVRRRRATAPQFRVDMLPMGTYTERGIVEEHGFSLPEWLDRPEHLFRVDPAMADLAVLTEPVAVAEKGVNEAHVVQRARLGADIWAERPPRVLVTGLGPIAFAGVIAAVARGWPTTVYGRDATDTSRAELVRSFGADYVSPETVDFSPADPDQDGYDLLLECTGSDELLVRASAAMASHGVLVWLGSSRLPEPRPLNVALMVRDGLLRNQVQIGSVNAAPRDFLDALAHLAQLGATHRRELRAVITDEVGLDEALWHYEHRTPQGIKTVVRYD
ncbi:MAG: alcohol dehydrogenase catalytic domain-containing protein [Pirellulales bacterium]|nr:alcohol dehydrogenase catalytic domain-containing protein [Pirellulales bacterium]